MCWKAPRWWLHRPLTNSCYSGNAFPTPNSALGAGNWSNLYILGGFAAQNVQISSFSPSLPAAGEKGQGDEG